jgi:sn-glycerol 3-phosphate transport system permease protein
MNASRHTQWVPYLLLIPSFLILLPFLYWPTLQSFLMSAYREAPFGARKFFCGFDNYRTILTDPSYLSSIGKTLSFVALVIGLGLTISLLGAVMLNRKIKGAKFYRVCFFIPYAVSPAVAASLWVFLLNPAAGFLNYLLYRMFHIQPPWLTDGFLAFLAVSLANIWKDMGFNILFYLAGLQSIPESVIEASQIDGASPLQRLLKITIPLLSPTTFYLVVMNLIFSVFENFGIIDIMTGGGPAAATNFLIYNLYRDVFINFRPGVAAAQSVILFLLIIGVTVAHFKYNGDHVHYQ